MPRILMILMLVAMLIICLILSAKADDVIDWRGMTRARQLSMIYRLSKSRGSCYSLAWDAILDYHDKGYPVKMGHGWYKGGEYHAWCEYYRGGSWHIVDRTMRPKYQMRSFYKVNYYTRVYL